MEFEPVDEDVRVGESASQAADTGARSAMGERAFSPHRAIGNALQDTREAWPGMSAYERFEQVVSLILTGLISLVIVAALINLTFRIFLLVFFGLLDPAEQSIFQAVFGMIFLVLIALEFNHSILRVLERKESIVRVKTVVLIALLALARKFIILDATKTEPLTIIGLAVAIIALGAVHWLVRDQDRKEALSQHP